MTIDRRKESAMHVSKRGDQITALARQTKTTPTTFAPDWDALDKVYYRKKNDNPSFLVPILEAVIKDYERQREAAGFVSVRRKDLAYLLRHQQLIRASDRAGMGVIKRVNSILGGKESPITHT
jgi:hypothetical protein